MASPFAHARFGIDTHASRPPSARSAATQAIRFGVLIAAPIRGFVVTNGAYGGPSQYDPSRVTAYPGVTWTVTLAGNATPTSIVKWRPDARTRQSLGIRASLA